MRRIVARGFLVAVLCVGCASADKKPRYPDDPLLASKKPVDGKHDTVRTDLLARAEPLPLPLPTALLAATRPGDRSTTATPSVPTSSPPAVPTAEAASGMVRAIPAVRRRVAGTFGQAADLTWLQGVLERTPAGSLQLRHARTNTANPQAGVVLLDEDARLGVFRPGDVLMVEGEPSGPGRYRVHSLWLVKRGEGPLP